MNSTPKNSIRVFLTNPFWLLWLAVFAYLLVVLRSAWLAEDAFITFRTVDNFIHGYGLRWNVVERVQAYTHPLWMFLVSLFYFATGEIFYTVILLSVAVSLAAVLVLALGVAASFRMAIFGFVLLMSSKAFVDYSTSGLENPLTHLLLAIFLWIYLRQEVDAKALLWLSLVAGLATLNRMDTLLLFIPALAYRVWAVRWWRGLGAVLLGFVPFIAWELFSLVYYGFLFPNTAYAKLNTGILGSELIVQGLYYLLNSLKLDPLTLVTIAAGMLTALLKRERRQLSVLVGAGLYLLYVVRIGGDFMSGRFLTPLFFVAAILICRNCSFSRLKMWATASVVLVVGMGSSRSPLRSGVDYGVDMGEMIDARHISDERGLYYRNAGLLPALEKDAAEEYPDHWWASRGRAVRDHQIPTLESGGYEGFLISSASHCGLTITTWTNVGFSGFYAGPQVHIIDAIALAEPLLARLPARVESDWGPGHFNRIMPEGYIETHHSGQNLIADKNLAVYFDKLCIITRGDLFDGRRWREIWNMHTGKYDPLIDVEFYRYPSNLVRRLADMRIRPSEPRTHCLLGEEYLRQERIEEGIEEFELALELNPESFNIRMRVGNALFQKQLFERAQKVYQEAVQLEPQRYDPYANLGSSLMGLNRPEEAEDAFRKATVCAPDNPRMFHYLGAAALAVGHRTEALEAFERAVSLESTQIEPYLILASLLWEDGRRAEAAKLYSETLAKEFKNVVDDTYTNLGLKLFKQGNRNAAINAYRRALERDEESLTARVNLGWTLFLQNRLDEAVKEYHYILKRRSNSQAQFNLGLAYLAKGEIDAARATYARGVEEFGAEEAEKIGAVDDLQEFVGRGAHASAAQAILDTYWKR